MLGGKYVVLSRRGKLLAQPLTSFQNGRPQRREPALALKLWEDFGSTSNREGHFGEDPHKQKVLLLLSGGAAPGPGAPQKPRNGRSKKDDLAVLIGSPSWTPLL